MVSAPLSDRQRAARGRLNDAVDAANAGDHSLLQSLDAEALAEMTAISAKLRGIGIPEDATDDDVKGLLEQFQATLYDRGQKQPTDG